MRQRERFFFVFVITISAGVVIFLLSGAGYLKLATGSLEKGASLIGIKMQGAKNSLPFVSKSNDEKKSQEENIETANLISQIEKLKKENAALLSQFQTTTPTSYNLTPARIVNAISGSLVIDKGKEDGIKTGYTVVYKNNLVGKVIRASSHLSKIDLITKESSTFSIKTQNDSIGVAKGDGKTITLDNILLSDNLKINDIVTTKGDLNIEGLGYPPDLVVGKIVSIEKIPSDLFQKAKVESLIDFGGLSTIFIFKGE